MHTGRSREIYAGTYFILFMYRGDGVLDLCRSFTYYYYYYRYYVCRQKNKQIDRILLIIMYTGRSREIYAGIYFILFTHRGDGVLDLRRSVTYYYEYYTYYVCRQINK